MDTIICETYPNIYHMEFWDLETINRFINITFFETFSWIPYSLWTFIAAPLPRYTSRRLEQSHQRILQIMILSAVNFVNYALFLRKTNSQYETKGTRFFVSRRIASRIHEISDLKKALVLSLRRFLFYSNSRPPARTIRASDFLWNNLFNTGGAKNVPSSFFPAKMGLNSGEPSTRTAHAFPCLHTQ